jgi:hypothetical protein
VAVAYEASFVSQEAEEAVTIVGLHPCSELHFSLERRQAIVVSLRHGPDVIICFKLKDQSGARND